MKKFIGLFAFVALFGQASAQMIVLVGQQDTIEFSVAELNVLASDTKLLCVKLDTCKDALIKTIEISGSKFYVYMESNEFMDNLDEKSCNNVNILNRRYRRLNNVAQAYFSMILNKAPYFCLEE